MPTLAPTPVEVAREAKAEYTEACKRGEEPHYPYWVDAVLNAEKAEELTRRIEALGRTA